MRIVQLFGDVEVLPRGARLFAALDAAEIPLIARTVTASHRLRLERVAATATRLGNGWLYLILSLIVFLVRIESPLRLLATSATSLLIGFAAYPACKRYLARRRPCDYQPSLVHSLQPPPLDRYSCPSGHAMTAAAYCVPLAFATPTAIPLMVLVCVIVSWSRVALAHHYVTDVVAGTLLGAGIGAGVAALVY